MLGSLTEICIVTPDYKKTIDGLAHLGVGPFQVFRLHEQTCRDMEFRGSKGDFDIIACFAKQGEMAVEIMQPVNGRSMMQDYLENNGGRPGLQHVAWGMEEGATEQRVKAMAARDIQVGMRGTWLGKTGMCQVCSFIHVKLQRAHPTIVHVLRHRGPNRHHL